MSLVLPVVERVITTGCDPCPGNGQLILDQSRGQESSFLGDPGLGTH